MVINVTSDRELAQLAELLLKKYQTFLDTSKLCADCSKTTIINNPVSSEAILSSIEIARFSFETGAVGAPPANATVFEIRRANDTSYTNIEVEIYREGLLQSSPSQYTFDETTNRVTLVVPLTVNLLGDGERIFGRIFQKAILDTGKAVAI